MKPFPGLFLLIISLFAFACSKNSQSSEFGLVIHGGAGGDPDKMSAQFKAESETVMMNALQAGYDILEAGGNSMDAVSAAIVILEDSPLFNAGKGAVFTSEGTHELDASIMDGETLNTGAVAGVKNTKNPIKLARLVMEQSKHVLMAGSGAESFGKQHGIELVDQSYFFTERQKANLENAKAKEKSQSSLDSGKDYRYYGTVGAVALDKSGNLAAGTSTGGMTNKRFGRIGDSPIVGAGTYASNQSCAVSGTGHGEYFIRLNVARDIAALMEYQGLSAEEASREVIHNKLTDLGGGGGVIVIDREGRMAMPFNTMGMRRGYVDSSAEFVVQFGTD